MDLLWKPIFLQKVKNEKPTNPLQPISNGKRKTFHFWAVQAASSGWYLINLRLYASAISSSAGTVSSPDNLRIWGKTSDGSCKLCTSPTCTLFHILVHCPFSLLGKRYTWRHDSVLRTLEPHIKERLRNHNTSKVTLDPNLLY